MFKWMKRLHMHSGLFAYTAFIVWGITGIWSVFLPAPDNWPAPDVSEVREIPYDAPGDLDDTALALRVFEASGVKMSYPPREGRRNEDHHLVFTVYSPSGPRDLTYLEEDKLIRVAYRQNQLSGYLAAMHAGSTEPGPPDLPLRIWGVYNEAALWGFAFMTLSGLYLWLATRPRLIWAWATLAGSAVVFVVLWFLTR
jgi:hypothetical protein